MQFKEEHWQGVRSFIQMIRAPKTSTVGHTLGEGIANLLITFEMDTITTGAKLEGPHSHLPTLEAMKWKWDFTKSKKWCTEIERAIMIKNDLINKTLLEFSIWARLAYIKIGIFCSMEIIIGLIFHFHFHFFLDKFSRICIRYWAWWYINKILLVSVIANKINTKTLNKG